MFKNLFIQFVFSFLSFTGFSQRVALEEVCILPAELDENSGMVAINDSTYWFLNDSGNEPILYLVNNQCEILKRKYLLNAPNIDWEEMAHDPDGNIYIGDFGNNKNRRESLYIYKVSTQSLYNKADTIQPEWGICYSYALQTAFPPPKEERNFDMEAMVFFQDSLYLFSKNRTQPFDAVTYLYALPAVSGVYQLSPKTSAKTLEGMGEVNWVAGAEFLPKENVLLLLGYDKIFAYQGSTPIEALNGKKTMIDLGLWKQFECIAIGNKYLFISNERNKLNTPILYRVPKEDILKLLK